MNFNIWFVRINQDDTPFDDESQPLVPTFTTTDPALVAALPQTDDVVIMSHDSANDAHFQVMGRCFSYSLGTEADIVVTLKFVRIVARAGK